MDSITDSREGAQGAGALSLQALWGWGRGQQGIVAAGEGGLHSRGWTGHTWCCDQSGKVTEMDGGDLKEVEEKHVFSDGEVTQKKTHRGGGDEQQQAGGV